MMVCKYVCLTLCVTIVALSASVVRPAFAELEKIDASQVAVNNDEREDGDDYTAEIELTLINKHGKQRVRRIRRYQKDYGEDDKSVMFFLEPADVKNTGFLTWNYANESKDDEQWLYLPALKKVRRIASSGRNEYFMGSDFTYADLGDNEVDDYDYNHLEPEVIDGIECYHLERLPKNKEVIEETGYGRTEMWIRPDNWLLLKAVYYDKDLKLLKEFTAGSLEEIDGIWTVKTMVMDHKQNMHTTIFRLRSINYNTRIEDDVFSERRLKRGGR